MIKTMYNGLLQDNIDAISYLKNYYDSLVSITEEPATKFVDGRTIVVNKHSITLGFVNATKMIHFDNELELNKAVDAIWSKNFDCKELNL